MREGSCEGSGKIVKVELGYGYNTNFYAAYTCPTCLKRLKTRISRNRKPFEIIVKDHK